MSDLRKSVLLAFFLTIVNFFYVGIEGAFFAVQVFFGTFLLLYTFFNSIKNTTVFSSVPFLSLVLIWSMVCSPFIAYASGYNIALPPKRSNGLSGIYLLVLFTCFV